MGMEGGGGGSRSGGRSVGGARGHAVLLSESHKSYLSVGAVALEVVDDGTRELLVAQAFELVTIMNVFFAVVVLHVIRVAAHEGVPVRDAGVLDLVVAAGGALADGWAKRCAGTSEQRATQGSGAWSWRFRGCEFSVLHQPCHGRHRK